VIESFGSLARQASKPPTPELVTTNSSLSLSLLVIQSHTDDDELSVAMHRNN
jgi:hypothetical protein